MTFLTLGFFAIACSPDGTGADSPPASPPIVSDSDVGTESSPVGDCSAGDICTYWAPMGGDTTAGLPAIVPAKPPNDGTFLVGKVAVDPLGMHVASARATINVIADDSALTAVGRSSAGSDVVWEVYFPDTGSGFDMGFLDERTLVVVAGGLWTLDVETWAVQLVDTAVPVDVAPVGEGWHEDDACIGRGPSFVASYVAGDQDALYFTNSTGVYKAAAEFASATQIARICDEDIGAIAVSEQLGVAYVAKRQEVLRLELASGSVTTFATFVLGGCEAGRVAPCQPIMDLAIDERSGEVFVADNTSCVIAYGATGLPRVAAGDCDAEGNAGDGGLPVDALMRNVSSVEVGPDGNLFLADRGSHVVRVVLTSP